MMKSKEGIPTPSPPPSSSSSSLPTTAATHQPEDDGDDDEDKLKWRGNPEETFSDWTIEVIRRPRRRNKDKIATTGTTTSLTASRTAQLDHHQQQHQQRHDATQENADTPQQQVVDRYYVHKFALAFGSRKSKYFKGLFKYRNLTRENGCRLEDLDVLQALAFPQLLDYVYNPNSPLVITTQTSTALHSLGIKYEMVLLEKDAKQFIQNDLSLETVETYYDHATRLKDKIILQLVEEFVGHNLHQIQPTSKLVQKISDPNLWLKAYDHYWVATTTATSKTSSASSSPMKGGEEQEEKADPKQEEEDKNENAKRNNLGQHFSCLIAELGKHHRQQKRLNNGTATTSEAAASTSSLLLDSKSFRLLSSSLKMPSIHPDVALVLCEIADELEEELMAATASTGTAASAVAATNPQASDNECNSFFQVSSFRSASEDLQERCATALSTKWKDLLLSSTTDNVDKDDETIEILRKRKSTFLVHLLVMSLEKAANELDTSRSDLMSCQQQLKQQQHQLDAQRQEWNRQQTFLQNELKESQAVVERRLKQLYPLEVGSKLRVFESRPLPLELGRYLSGNGTAPIWCHSQINGIVKFRPILLYDDSVLDDDNDGE